jgi:cell division inhibitor SulA/protein ImuA
MSLPPLPGLPSGFDALDQALPGGGWPVGAISEIFPEHEGIGEVSLVLPALAHLCRHNRAIAWVVPSAARTPPAHASRRRETTRRPTAAAPRIPCAPALAAAGVDLKKLLLVEPKTPQEALWALRQIIASKAFGAVVGWLEALDAHSLRRLKIAAEDSPTAVLLFRPARLMHQASSAALKLHLAARGPALEIAILKRRGAPLPAPIRLPTANMSPGLSEPAAPRRGIREAACR